VVVPLPDHSTSTTDWWSTEIQLWWRDFDELGHLTAAAYPAAYEEAVGRFVTQMWEVPSPAYVTARTNIHYLNEVRPSSRPITIHVRAERAGATSFVLNMVLSDASGRRCSVAQTRYVAWDPQRRGPRPLSADERSALGLLSGS